MYTYNIYTIILENYIFYLISFFFKPFGTIHRITLTIHSITINSNN